MKFLFLFFFIFGPQTVIAREPTIHEVQQQALRYAGYDHDEISSWSKRSRWSAALPRLQVGFDRDVKDAVSLTTEDTVSISGGNVTVGPAQTDFDERLNRGTGFDVRAVWYLNELIFNRDQLDVSSEQRRWHQDRIRLLGEIHKAYFDREELREQLKNGSYPRQDKGHLERLFGERTAILDGLTGGWFSKELKP